MTRSKFPLRLLSTLASLIACDELSPSLHGSNSHSLPSPLLEILKLFRCVSLILITLCAEEVCPIVPGNTKTLHWPFPDPAQPEKSIDEQMNLFRDVRDQISKKIKEFAKELR